VTEALRRLRRDAATAILPAVVSGVSEKDRQEVIEAGAHNYLANRALMSSHHQAGCPANSSPKEPSRGVYRPHAAEINRHRFKGPPPSPARFELQYGLRR